jgi:Family of unknown function (DUF6510)
MNDELDGNSLGGALGEIFAVDLTTALARCAGCAAVSAVAEVHVYSDAPGWVARCPECEGVLFRVVRAPNRAWIEMRGVVRLEIAMPDA